MFFRCLSRSRRLLQDFVLRNDKSVFQKSGEDSHFAPLDLAPLINIIEIVNKILAEKEFVRKIEEISNQRVSNCYQCGRCTAGCPFAKFMDAPPSQVIRFIQLGLKDEVLAASAPWFCAACLVCQGRCPKGVDIPRLMEAVRTIHLRAKEEKVDVTKLDEELLLDMPPLVLMSVFSKYSY